MTGAGIVEEALRKATMTTDDMSGAGEAPTSVSQGNAVCPECGKSGGKHKKGCKYRETNPSGKEVVLTKSTPADKTPEPFSSSKTSNWVAKAGGLPNYVQHVAHALVRKGKSESAAIRMAIGIIRNWAEGKGDVSDSVRAAAGKALAQWEKMKAGTHVSKALSDEVDSVSLDDPEICWAMETAGRAIDTQVLHKNLFKPDKVSGMQKDFDPDQPRDRNGRWVHLGHSVTTPSGVEGSVTGISGKDHVSVDYLKPGDKYATAHGHRPSELRVLDTDDNRKKDEEQKQSGGVVERLIQNLTPAQLAVFNARVKVMGNSREEALRHASAHKG